MDTLSPTGGTPSLRLLVVALVTALAACTPATGPDQEQPSPDPGPSEVTDDPTEPGGEPSPSPSGSEDDTGSVGGPLFDGEPLTAVEGQALVFIDGWSLRSAGTQPPGARVDFADRALELVPVTGEQLVALAGSHPALVEAVLGRMVDGATTVACEETGCLVGGSPTEQDGGDVACVGEVCVADWYRIDAEELATFARAEAVPVYGEVYDGWQVNHLLYVAAVDVGGASQLAVTRGAAELRVPLAAALAVDAGEGEEPVDPSGNLALGFGDDFHLVAYGLGRVFRPVQQWREIADAPYLIPVAVDRPALEEELDGLGALPLMGGAGTVRSAAGALTFGQLSYFTSPTTGCGVGLHCVPSTSVAGEVEVAASVQLPVCGISGGQRTTAIVTDATLEMDLPAPIHQLGMWNGEQPDSFERRTGGFFSGLPELAPDGTRMRIMVVQVMQAQGQVYDVVGSAWQLGVDDPAAAEQEFDPAARVEATGIWELC